MSLPRKNEPLYSFVRGQGWILTRPAHILTQEDCKGPWFDKAVAGDVYSYPDICRDWTIMEDCSELKVGDIVPYGNKIDIIYKVEDREAFTSRAYRDGEYDAEFQKCSVFAHWYGVARQC